MKVLHIDASGRGGFGGLPPYGAYGSYSRRLSRHFVECLLAQLSDAEVKYRDLSANPPRPVDQAWISAAFSRSELSIEQLESIAESDFLIDELLWADIVVIGTPMYNFNMPANLKAWVDNIVRVKKTLLEDPSPVDPKHPFIPVFKGRKLPVVVLSARGDSGMDPGGEFEHINHLEPSIRTALGFIGINEIYSIAVEHTAEGGDALEYSLESALSRVENLANNFTQLSDSQSEDVKVIDVIRNMFLALNDIDVKKINSLIMPDFYAFELGVRMDGKEIIDLIKRAKESGVGFTWEVTEPQVVIEGSVAWITYFNVGSKVGAQGDMPQRWLESAFLRHDGVSWRIQFLHSTESVSEN